MSERPQRATTTGRAAWLSLNRLPRTATTRAIFFTVGDIGLWIGSYVLALLVRFDGVIPPADIAAIPAVLLLFIPVKLLWHALFRLYQVSWRLVGITEIVQVGKASTMAAFTLASALLLLREVPPFGSFPRSVIILDYLLSTAFIALFRLSRRLVDDVGYGRGSKEGIRVLLVGAGAAGERINRAMVNGRRGRYRPVAFIDDDPAKHGAYVNGLRVLGGREAIPGAAKALGIEELVITIPSAPAGAIRDIVRWGREAGLKRIKVLPSLNELLSGRVTLNDIRDVNIDDLLGRETARLSDSRVEAFLRGRTVVVTGAAGSIGAELVRQIARTDAASLILIDNNETALFDLERTFLDDQPRPAVRVIVADIRDGDKIHRLFNTLKPDVVYHAAAYKHVPLMELHPDEAVRTNILGTLNVAEAALGCGTGRFVLISTDKAVRPSSIMGATKYVAEMLIRAFNGRATTRFLAVRFGNVIGSRGSVIPVMQEQIRQGGPVTVTDPQMTRYFMSTREAGTLVLQASALDDPHDIFLLDMGRPIRILDLAHELIRLSGLEPDKDIPIVFTGVRPGERLHETLDTPEEPLQSTEIPQILAVDSNGQADEFAMRFALHELDRCSRSMDAAGIRNILQRLTEVGAPSGLNVGRRGDEPAATA